MQKKSSLGKYLIIALFIGIVLASGCASKKAETTNLGGQTFVGGNEGLAVSFAQGEPPSELLGGDSISFTINVENKGETNIISTNPAKVYLSGINPSTFGITSATKMGPLSLSALDGVQKVQNTFYPGGQDSESINGTAPTNLPGDTSFTAVAKVCYPYSTQALSKVCLRSNLFRETTGGSICQTQGIKEVANSGAPLQVISLEQIPGSTTTTLQIKVKNAGNGFSYTASDCANLKTTDLNKFKINVTLSNGLLQSTTDKCKGTADITLINGEASVMCKFAITATTEYEDIVRIELKYNYASQATTSFRVIKVIT